MLSAALSASTSYGKANAVPRSLQQRGAQAWKSRAACHLVADQGRRLGGPHLLMFSWPFYLDVATGYKILIIAVWYGWICVALLGWVAYWSRGKKAQKT